jgi:hypothetical protein
MQIHAEKRAGGRGVGEDFLKRGVAEVGDPDADAKAALVEVAAEEIEGLAVLGFGGR